MASISRKKPACWPCPDRKSTSRSCDTTTARRFVLSPSERVTWCYAEFISQMGSTSWPHPGRDHSSSAEHSRTMHITSSTARKALGTEILQERKHSVPGTPSYYARFTVESCKCTHAIRHSISKAIMHLKDGIRSSLCELFVSGQTSAGKALS